MRSTTRLRSLVGLAVVGTCAAACGGGAAKVGEQPSWRRQGAGTKDGTDGRAPEVESGREFSPTTPAARRYNDPPRTPAPSSPLADEIVAAVAEVAAASGVTAPQPDGRLYAAARELAEIMPENAPLSYRLVEFAMQRHGIIEPSPLLTVFWGPIEDPNPVKGQVMDRLPGMLASGPFTRVGVGSARRGKGDMGVTIVALQASHLDTNPIARALPREGILQIEGRLLDSFRKPKVFVTRENGMVEQPQVELIGNSRFRSAVACLRHVGRQQVEIFAEDQSGPRVLAIFPVWCNARPPTSIRLDQREELVITTAEEAERQLVELINRDRKRFGLPPLEVDEDARAVARAHSQEMFDTGVVAHVSPTTGSASDRVRAAGIKTLVVEENLAQAPGVISAHEGLMNSPGHRATILTVQANRIGVGVVVGEDEYAQRELFVTELFIYVTPRIPAEEAKKVLHGKIRAVRNLSHDDALGALAQRYAEDVAGGLSKKEASKRATKGAELLAQRYSRATTVVVTLGRLEEFPAKSSVGDSSMTDYGLGVAQGPHPEFGEQAIYVVLILAKRR